MRARMLRTLRILGVLLAATGVAGPAAAQSQAINGNIEGVVRDTSGAVLFKGEIITGPAQITYDVPALPAGTYTYICSVHPNMTGTLTVGS